MKNLYSVGIGEKKPNRFIEWCNEKWYETCDTPLNIFTKEEAMHIINDLLPQHFVYKAYLIDGNRKETCIERFTKKVKKSIGMEVEFEL